MEFASRFFIYLPEGPLTQISPREAGRLGALESAWRLPALAGLRMRLVEARLVREGNAARRVHDMRFSWLPLDDSGRFDRDAWDDDEMARIALLARNRSPDLRDDSAVRPEVVDAADLFRARHGCWQPSSTERQELQRAALGIVPVPHLKGLVGAAGRRRRLPRSKRRSGATTPTGGQTHVRQADNSASRGNVSLQGSRPHQLAD